MLRILKVIDFNTLTASQKKEIKKILSDRKREFEFGDKARRPRAREEAKIQASCETVNREAPQQLLIGAAGPILWRRSTERFPPPKLHQDAGAFRESLRR